MLHQNFFKNREKTIVFEALTEENSWEPERTPMATLSGLAKITTPGTLAESGSEAITGLCIVRLDTTEGIELLKIGDLFTVAEVTYTVTRIDLSGTLPSSYPYRVEGTLK